MKVVLVGTGSYPIPPTGYGAVERVLAEYGQALNRAGVSVRIVSPMHFGGPVREYRFAFRLPAALRRMDYDVLHVSTPVVANRLSSAGLPFVYTSHSRHWFWRDTWRHRWGYWLERRAVRRAAGVVALTSAVEAAMRASLPPGPAAPIVVLPYGIDLDAYAAAWDRRTGRRALGVGLVAPLKRWELAAAALKGTGVSFRIAGPIFDRRYADQVRAAGENVELLGEVDASRLQQLYAESDLLVHPSRVEVLPRAVVEAMAASLPIVGSPTIAPVVQTGEWGLVAPPGTSEEDLVRFLRDSVLRLVADGELRRAMGTAGRAQASTTFSWDRVVAAHLAFYERVRAADV